MDPATIALTILSAGSKVAEGMSQKAQAMSESARLENEALLADTQGLQRDTIAREDLSKFISATRSARAANGLSAFSPNAMMLLNEAESVNASERSIRASDSRLKAANLRTAAKSVAAGGRMSLMTGIIKGGVSIAQGAYNWNESNS